jgi:hypothetical protein
MPGMAKDLDHQIRSNIARSNDRDFGFLHSGLPLL